MTGVGADLRRWWRRTGRYRPSTATGWIVAITIACYVIELLARTAVLSAFVYAPAYSLPATGAPFEPWRMLTAVLLHLPIGPGAGIVALTHIGFNMYALYLFGRPLESVLGGGRFVALYVLSGFGGSVAVLYAGLVGLIGISTPVLGASGAVFGVLGASAVIQRRLGIDVRYLYVLILVNFALAFVLSGIAWQAHVGGLVTGAVTGWAFAANRGPRRRNRAIGAGFAIGVVLVLLAVVPAVVLPAPAG
jgi:membrane associated rhomboid family serine protease